MMDFQDVLVSKINEQANLPIRLKLGYLGVDDSLVMFSIPGGRTVREFYGGQKDIILNYEFNMKSKNPGLIDKTLWRLTEYLEDMDIDNEIVSQTDSFKFKRVRITNTPYINQYMESRWYQFSLTIQVDLSTD